MEFVHQSFKPQKFIGMTKGKTYIKEAREFRFLWTAHFGSLPFHTFLYEKLWWLVVEKFECAACARHNYNRRVEEKFTTVIGEIKLNPWKDEYLTLLLKHTVKLAELSLVPRSLVTKRSVNRELREADFPLDPRASEPSTQMLWVILNYFTILHRQQMLIKLFTRAPVIGIEKMSDFLTVLTRLPSIKVKYGMQGGYARLEFTHVLRSLLLLF